MFHLDLLSLTYVWKNKCSGHKTVAKYERLMKKREGSGRAAAAQKDRICLKRTTPNPESCIITLLYFYLNIFHLPLLFYFTIHTYCTMLYCPNTILYNLYQIAHTILYEVVYFHITHAVLYYIACNAVSQLYCAQHGTSRKHSSPGTPDVFAFVSMLFFLAAIKFAY